MAYDYKRLCLRIIEMVGTQRVFDDKMGLSERSVSLKLNNEVPWKQQEISKATEILDISPEMIPTYFFTEKVQY